MRESLSTLPRPCIHVCRIHDDVSSRLEARSNGPSDYTKKSALRTANYVSAVARARRNASSSNQRRIGRITWHLRSIDGLRGRTVDMHQDRRVQRLTMRRMLFASLRLLATRLTRPSGKGTAMGATTTREMPCLRVMPILRAVVGDKSTIRPFT